MSPAPVSARYRTSAWISAAVGVLRTRDAASSTPHESHGVPKTCNRSLSSRHVPSGWWWSWYRTWNHSMSWWAPVWLLRD